MQCFSFDDLMNKEFAQKHHINLEDIVKINIKEDFMLKMDSGVTLHIPLEEIEMIARQACLACTEFANDFSDIAVGGLGSPDGYTTVLIRSVLGKKIYTQALYHGYIENRTYKTLDERKAEKTRMLSLIETFAEKKRERGEKRLSEL